MVTKVKGGVLDESALSGKNMTGDIAFDTTTLKIDSSNNRVGVGTASPAALLHLSGDSDTSDEACQIVINDEDSTAGSGVPSIQFKRNNTNTGRIRGTDTQGIIMSGSSAQGDDLVVQAGKVGIGETSPDSLLHATGTNNSAGDLFTAVGRGNCPSITLQNAGTTDNNNVAIFFDNDNTTGAAIGARFVDHSDEETQLRFSTHDGSSVKERIFIDGSGNFGINMIPATVGNDKVLSIYESVTPRIKLHNSTTGTAGTDGGEINMTSSDLIIENREAGNQRFFNNGSERMRITSGGQVLIAHASAVGSHNEKLGIDCDQAAGYGIFVSGDSSTGGSSNITAMRFYDSGSSAGIVGSIIFNDTVTAFNTSSDYRLKENITYSWDATTRLKQLKPARFNFIKNKDKTMDGFLAHEVSSIVPEAVSGEKDGEEMQELDQSKLVPLLVKTVQELEARITELESK